MDHVKHDDLKDQVDLDIIQDEQESDSGGESATLETRDLEKDLHESKEKVQLHMATAQRAQADYSNLKKRFDKEREELTSFAAEMLMTRLLPAIDNLHRAVDWATEADKKTSIYQGVKMTLQQFDDTAGQVGFERLDVNIGDVFDPHRHEAIETAEGQKDTVIAVVDHGYTLHDKVVRPARVKVGQG
jgi:molecular chaperone GrpE